MQGTVSHRSRHRTVPSGVKEADGGEGGSGEGWCEDGTTAGSQGRLGRCVTVSRSLGILVNEA